MAHFGQLGHPGCRSHLVSKQEQVGGSELSLPANVSAVHPTGAVHAGIR